MDTQDHTDDTRPAPDGRSTMGPKVAKGAAGAATVVALILGGGAIARSNDAASAAAAQGRPAQGAPPGGTGTAVTGATLEKLTEAATAKYPGTVERAMKLPDGSYIVHVIKSGNAGEIHARVSSAFQVTGVDTGGPGGPGGPAGPPPGAGEAPSAPGAAS